jgi:predicted phosphate transport protein (TIGR00153 family)
MRAIERQIDEFLDIVSEAGIVFEQGITLFMDHSSADVVLQKVDQLQELENRGDQLRIGIETDLYTNMLIPESRGDVLHLLDALDDLTDGFETNFLNLTLEQPDIPETIKGDLKELTSTVVKCVEHTVLASRAFFRDLKAVRDHVHKIGFYESEADAVAIRIKRLVFGSDLPLDRKMHLRDWVDCIDRIADNSENAGDHLSIFAIKRSL